MPLLVMPTVLDDPLLRVYFFCGINATLSCGGDHLQLEFATDTANCQAGAQSLPARYGASNEACEAVPPGPAGAQGLPARYGVSGSPSWSSRCTEFTSYTRRTELGFSQGTPRKIKTATAPTTSKSQQLGERSKRGAAFQSQHRTAPHRGTGRGTKLLMPTTSTAYTNVGETSKISRTIYAQSPRADP